MRVFNGKRLALSIAVIAVAALLAVMAACLIQPQEAKADPTYELVLYDGDIPCSLGAVGNLYCYEADYYKSYRRYTFTYHEGINLRLGAKTQTGEDIAWQPAEAMQSVKHTADGSVDNYLVQGSIEGTITPFYIRIQERPLTVVWAEETLYSEFGEAIAPQVTLWDAETDTATLQAIQTEITFLASDDSPFNSEYVKGLGKGDYLIKAVLAEKGNYCLADNTNTYHVAKFSGEIVVERQEETVVYNGAPRSAIELLGATVRKGGVEVEGYAIKVKYSRDCVKEDNSLTALATAGTFYIAFQFEDTTNYTYYRSPASASEWYTVNIEMANVVLSTTESAVSLQYDKNRTAETAAEELYGKRNEFLLVADETGMEIVSSPEDYTFRYRDTDADAWRDTPPATVGNYQVRVHFNGNGNYHETAAENDLIMPLEITKRLVRLAWKPYDTKLAYGERFDLAGQYRVDGTYREEFEAWIADGNEAEYTLAYEMSPDLVEWHTYTLSEALPLPGWYQATVVMDSELYCGETSVAARIHIEKVALTKDDVSLNETSFVYGEEVAQVPVLGEGKAIDGTWRIEYRQGGETAAVKDVGVYDVYLTLDGDSMYSCALVYEGADGLTLSRRPVTLYVWNYDVVYGDSTFSEGVTYGDDGTAMVWWPHGTVLTGDAQDFLSHLSVSVQAPNGTWVEQINASFVCADSGYPLKITSTNANYQVTFAKEGKLFVNPRPLRVTVTGSTSIFEGAAPRLEVHVNLENDVSDEEFDQISSAFTLAYRDSAGNAVEGTPAEVGVYTVELVQADVAALKNYRVQYAPVKLTIKTTALATSDSSVEVSGKFNTTETLLVEKGVNSRYSAAVNDLKGYHVVTVYEIVNPMNSESNSQITFRLAASSDLRNAKVLYLEGNEWVELDYTRDGEYVTFTQRTMSTKYVIAAQREINWTLIGLIAGGVVLVVIIIVVAVTVPQLMRKKKLAEEATKQVAAPTAASQAKPDEDEELDSFIETFDESTVERELTPAERIALREKEEKYQQYKARLARMRTSDRTMSDTLSGLGLDKNADEDEIIARMIEADEERARQVEEELKREQEEAKAKAEEETKTVILERSDEVLEQKTFAPTMPDSDDDDDIDI